MKTALTFARLKSTILPKKQIHDRQFSNTNILKKQVKLSKSVISEDQLKYTISNSLFNDCKSASVGGAVSVFSKTMTIGIENCVFTCCSANGHGGALSIACEKCSLKKLFFSECVCPRVVYGGQAFYTETKLITVNSTEVDGCPPSLDAGGFETAVNRRGIQSFDNINSSNNVATQYASGWLTAESSIFGMKFASFINNSSPNQIIALTQVRPDDEIIHANVVRNSAKDGLVYISGSFVILKDFVFVENNGPLICFTMSAGPAFVILDKCVTDFSKDDIKSALLVLSENKVVFGAEEPQTLSLPKQINIDRSSLSTARPIKIPAT